MCLIIDANVAAAMLSRPAEPDYATIFDWIHKRQGTVALGGKLAGELAGVSNAWRYLRTLLQAGRAEQYPEDVVNSEQQAVEATGLCRSDDPHIIALARVSGARVLFSRDADLQHDFKNRHLISKPRGNVYQRAEHRGLLDRAPKCRQYRRRARRPDLVR